jgi:hypothetical protein
MGRWEPGRKNHRQISTFEALSPVYFLRGAGKFANRTECIWSGGLQHRDEFGGEGISLHQQRYCVVCYNAEPRADRLDNGHWTWSVIWPPAVWRAFT